jgi:UTP--glucose-1-phosphate uridylyltransferase
MIRKAVIAVAGVGSRFFPISAAVNKCMLPILNKPIAQLAVEDCVAAGVEEIALVVAEGDTQVRRYFAPDPRFERLVEERGLAQRYEAVREVHRLAEFHFIDQPRDQGYGTALPVLAARKFIGEDSFFVMAGDDLLFRPDGGSDMLDLSAELERSGAGGAIAVAAVPSSESSRFGVVEARQGSNGSAIMTDIVEKPESVAGNPNMIHAFVSRSIVTAEIFTVLDALEPSPRSGELQWTDALTAFGRQTEVAVWPVAGRYFDCGNVGGWVAANVEVAEHQKVPFRRS